MRNIIWPILLVVLLFACAPPQDNNGVDPFKDSVPDNTIDELPDKPNIQETTKEPEEVQEEKDELIIEEPQEEQEIPEPSSGFLLKADVVGNTVELSWSQYTGEFKAYKITRSILNSNPQYPEKELIKTIPYIDQTTFIDEEPEPGVSYYVVTALDPLNRKTHTNPVSVELPNPYETPDQEISLTAEKTEQGVLLTWTRYDGNFLQYKIVRTQDHPFPKYPDDDLIRTVPYQNTTTMVDYAPEPGLNIYAITIIRPDKTRFTSERASITI